MADSLFLRESDKLSFIMAELETRLTHDVLTQLTAVQSSEERALIDLRQRLANGSERIVYLDDDCTEGAIHDLDNWRISEARDSTIAITEGVGLMLVFALLERTLRSIAEDLTSEADLREFLKRKKARSKVDSYLNYLRARCKLTVSLPAAFSSFRERERAVRDSFTHGEWDDHYFVARRGMAMKALLGLTPIFKELERAVIASASK